MGAEGSCCSGATDEALAAEVGRSYTGYNQRDIKASFGDLKDSPGGEMSSQGQKSPHKFKGGMDQED